MSLVSLDAFGSYTNAGGDFTLRNMPLLQSIAGFPVLDTVDANFQVAGNPQLPTCDAQGLQLQLASIGGTATVSGNLPDVCGG
ncbi:MAG: hypothetical protein KUG77_22990 [Nannocystaceae bacterium]|nr:hypothetical protein [Nannocystaceae bacterium]